MSSQVRTPAFPLRLAMIGSGAISRLHCPTFRDRPDVIRLSAMKPLNPLI